MNELLHLEGVCKQYQDFALQDITFSLPGGTIMGLIGENGAGKTTLFKSILGLVKTDAGRIQLFGAPFLGDDAAAKAQIGVVFDESYFHDNLTAQNVQVLLGQIFKKSWDSTLFHRLCDRFSLPQNKPIKTFSRGMKKKLSIAAAVAHHPRLLLLDEPTSGLDPAVREDILDLFLEFIGDEEHSILFSSHITTDLEKVSDYVMFLHEGRVIFQLEKDELLASRGIAKCRAAQAAQVLPEEVLCTRKLPADTEFLVADRQTFARRHPDILVDPASLEEILLFYVRGNWR
ncbi:MAG: ABC transporter ATP-binding protein [Pygmaiobacter massiliensis]|nr:ABC transporter ATP-binding protein [Pygmaiobacter massiliensis]